MPLRCMEASRMTRRELEALLPKLDDARVALIGDLCLDIYWDADMKKSELSRETPHHPLPIVSERFNPGGASNVAANIWALRPNVLCVLGVIGDDWRGGELMNVLSERGIDTGHIVKDPDRVTNAYIKPMRHGISDVVYEDPRIDFENYLPLSAQTEDRLIRAIDEVSKKVNVICVSDQLRCGCITSRVREHLCKLGRDGMTVIVDSRDRAAEYSYVTVKPNEIEASRAFADGSELDIERLSKLAADIAARNHRTTLTTLGSKGCLVVSDGTLTHCPACAVEPPIDFCGAGDTFLSCFGTFLSAGASAVDAARAANLASSVTIKKIGTTGTATREELLSAAF